MAVRPGIPAVPKCPEVVRNDLARHREVTTAQINLNLDAYCSIYKNII